jgi:predicted phage terminase large subunit-like protein
MILQPQPGAQERFLSSPADIVIYGGAAGGGKSYALLLEPLRHVLTNDGFNAVFFRRTTTQVRNPGGLWDESVKLYGALPGAVPLQTVLEWKFLNGGKIKFAHLEHETTVQDWQGSQIPLIVFDELCHFSAAQFWYLLSRNRSMCGVRPYVRASCNPDADSWVAELIAWWINQETGLAIPERSGVLRWFVRIGDVLQWADRPEDLPEQRAPDGQVVPPKSLTFIPAKLTDNAALMAADPGYHANLMAMPRVDRERLLGGNWKIRPAAGLYFQRTWCQVVDAVPASCSWARGWDLAATEPTEGSDPDWTAGTRMGKAPDGMFYVTDHRRMRGSPGKVERFILNTTTEDGHNVIQSVPQDPAAAGKAQAAAYVKLLAGYNIQTSLEGGEKEIRFGPFSAQAEAGNVRVLRGPWNEQWFSALEGFPTAKHDDDADSTSRAFRQLAQPVPSPARAASFPFMAR